MMMESKDFGTLALQLLEAATIPGQALEQAIQFKRLAESLQGGGIVLKPAAQDQVEGAGDV